ncbi:hypothetical protein LBMAG42_51980 [Deltaproteobacteria bacterium]|nr:hypothetical protein LBMAG42_51980 [Deltaproteobacteria bacterium]
MADDASMDRPSTDRKLLIAFGSRLRAVRDAAGLTQARLAERASLKTATVSLYENGRLSPTLSTLCVLARSLGVPPASLLEFDPAVTAEAVAALHAEVPVPDEWSALTDDHRLLMWKLVQALARRGPSEAEP